MNTSYLCSASSLFSSGEHSRTRFLSPPCSASERPHARRRPRACGVGKPGHRTQEPSQREAGTSGGRPPPLPEAPEAIRKGRGEQSGRRGGGRDAFPRGSQCPRVCGVSRWVTTDSAVMSRETTRSEPQAQETPGVRVQRRRLEAHGEKAPVRLPQHRFSEASRQSLSPDFQGLPLFLNVCHE